MSEPAYAIKHPLLVRSSQLQILKTMYPEEGQMNCKTRPIEKRLEEVEQKVALILKILKFQFSYPGINILAWPLHYRTIECPSVRKPMKLLDECIKIWNGSPCASLRKCLSRKGWVVDRVDIINLKNDISRGGPNEL